jgi:dihydrofolate reductase
MALPKVKLILLTDDVGGMSKNSQIPFSNDPKVGDSVKKFQKEKTIGQGKNCVIMGRNTFEMIGMKALEKRSTVVISKTLKQHQHPDVKIQSSIFDALVGAGQLNHQEVYVIGGEQIFYQFLTEWIHLVDSVIITRFKKTFGCDITFPMTLVKDMRKQDEGTLNWVRTTYFPGVVHPEVSYLGVLKESLSSETKVIDESRPTVKLNIGGSLTFPQVPGSFRSVPIFTTRTLNLIEVIQLSLEQRSFFEDIVKSIRKDPHGQIHICKLDHAVVQFFVSADRKKLGMLIHMFRVNLAEDLPLQVGVMSLMLHYISSIVGLVPDYVKVSWGEGYLRESPGLLSLLARTPLPFPRISFRRLDSISELGDFEPSNIQIDHYTAWPFVNLSGR